MNPLPPSPPPLHPVQFTTVGGKSASDAVMAMLWTLAYADGRTSLLEICDRADIRFAEIRSAADALLDAGLLASDDTAGVVISSG